MNERASASGWSALFWSAFDRSGTPMALLQSDRVLIAINRALVDDLGYQSENVVGRRSDLFVAVEGRSRLQMDWARLLRAGRLTGHGEFVRADGRHMYVQFAAHSVEVTGRQLILFVMLEMRLRPIALGPRSATAEKPLTPRELQIVAEIAMGRRWHEIAADLFITQSTVKTHVRNAMKKLGARSQAQLVAIALTTGVLDSRRIRGESSS